MKPQAVAALLNAQPFHPFTVFTKDGRSATVGHRELAYLTTTILFVFYGTQEPSDIPERFSIIPLEGIARVDVTPRRAKRSAA